MAGFSTWLIVPLAVAAKFTFVTIGLLLGDAWSPSPVLRMLPGLILAGLGALQLPLMGGVEVLVVGLTGGIATGKSTVAAMFVKLGAFLIDSDQIARQIVAPGSPVLAAIVAAFGPGILEDGQLDREKLGRIIFSSAKARARLNSITHPPILERLGRLIAENRPPSSGPVGGHPPLVRSWGPPTWSIGWLWFMLMKRPSSEGSGSGMESA